MTDFKSGEVRLSHARLAETLSGVTNGDVRRPSLLPGWTVGHVLTHVARNADSLVRLVEAAARGEVADQYPGGSAQRTADIEAGAWRPAAALVEDVVASAARWEAVCDATPEEAWRTGQGRATGGLWPVAEVPFRRWREVEVHHVDLGLDYGVADWPDAYVDAELARSVVGLAPRLAAGTAVDLVAADTGQRWRVPDGPVAGRQTVAADRRFLLAWLLGRGGGGPGFPALGPWTG